MNLFSDWSERAISYFSNFSFKINDIMANFTSLIGLLGIAIIIILLFNFKKVKLTPTIIARIGIALAVSCVLQVFRIYHFPMGGSVTLGGMIPLLLISFMYGPEIGILAGFLYGVLNLFLDPYFVHPVQVLFDYPLPSIAIGLAGYFKNKPRIGTAFVFFLKFICHFISGVVFFGSYAADYGMNPWIYSFVVNAPMVAADCVICIVILSIIPFQKIIKKM
ncbi:thiamine transporter [Clostridium sp. DSM 8431]|uniref:energy-coupled thiamine transporter ThiT n=1 Tax=Clostridium sp. DSM 8431 TaxID=1761781 RepID=UPI0008E579AD|nr:energy-coupled thiamine transporter ThiT [Clostridium sp. DSM 8431]SFU40698.1 thiamine transporter [Clostridium sp. DSM 8431]